MSTFNLSKKLQPARKAWKSFKGHLRSKLHHPKFVKAITIFRQRCKVAWRSVAPSIHRKFLALTKRTPPHSNRRLHHHFRPSYSVIYVDQLFPEPAPRAEPRKTKENMAEPSAAKSVNKSKPESTTATHDAGKIQTRSIDTVTSAGIHVDDGKGLAAAAGKGKAKAGESSKTSAPAKTWEIPALPQFRGIDERAEEFIAKFRQDRKLEREHSILEFEEMLKRSA